MNSAKSFARRYRIANAVWLIVHTVLLLGCGARLPQSEAHGTAILSFTWPPVSRLIPREAQSIRVTFQWQAQTVRDVNFPRREFHSVQNMRIGELPVGDHLVTATAYPNDDGTGTPMATASTVVKILASQETAFRIVMQSTITSLQLLPTSLSVPVYQDRGIAASARDAEGNVVLTRYGSLAWTSSDPASLKVDNVGRVTGIKTGTFTVTVKEPESGVTTTATVMVTDPEQTGPALLAPSSWPKQRGDLQNTSRTSAPTAGGTLLWKSIWFSNGVRNSAVVDTSGDVYVGSGYGYLYKFNGRTGDEMWERGIGPAGGASSPALAHNGTVFVVARSPFEIGVVAALRTDTGAFRWKRQIGEKDFGAIKSPTLGPNGTLYVGSVRSFYALNSATGETIWEKTMKSLDDSAAAIGMDGTVYVCGENLFALDPATGATKWTFNAEPGETYTSACVGADGTVYVLGLALHALDPGTGAIKWKYVPAERITIRPAIGRDGTIYTGASTLVALNPADGTQKWTTPIGKYPWFQDLAIVSDGTIYAVGDRLFAIDGVTGAKKWEFNPGYSIAPPAVGPDGTVYFGGAYMHAVR
jgi:outer membrane protein assembly factor BamB